MIGLIMCTRECNLRCRYCFEEENFKSVVLPGRKKINETFESSMPDFEKFL